MHASEFVANWYSLKGELVAAFTKADSETSRKIAALNLTTSQYEQLESIVDDVIRDTMYTLPRGLDGAARMVKEPWHCTLESGDGRPI